MNTLSALQSIQSSLSHLASEWVLVCSFFIALLLDLFVKRKLLIAYLVFTGLVISGVILYQDLQQADASQLLFNNFYQVSTTALKFKLLVVASSLLWYLPILFKNFEYKKIEYLYLIPVFVLSANLLIMSNHFLSIFLGVEFLSIISYLYIAFDIKNKQSSESSAKYVLYGAFSSAIMLYGITWLYGLTGTLYLDASFLSSLSKMPIDTVGMALLIFSAGFLFKISAVPFHYYSPDVYEGAQANTLGIISTVPKIAGFAILFHFIGKFHFNYQGNVLAWPNFPWEKVLAIVAIASMFIGNLSALTQKSLKRIFAYSSISHTGFMLLALVVYGATGLASLYFYLTIYSISSITLFFILQYWEQKYHIVNMEDLIGLVKQEKSSALAMIILLASLTGLPPLAGFFAKFFVFSAVFEQYQISTEPWLLYALIAGVLNTVIALFYYFNIARHLYLIKAEHKIEATSVLKNETVFIILMLLLTCSLLYFGLYPF
jgi:NADH-quinone oxidoreductase subunit N